MDKLLGARPRVKQKLITCSQIDFRTFIDLLITIIDILAFSDIENEPDIEKELHNYVSLRSALLDLAYLRDIHLLIEQISNEPVNGSVAEERKAQEDLAEVNDHEDVSLLFERLHAGLVIYNSIDSIKDADGVG